MRIKAPNVAVITGKLSGGNQQKVVLSKWMFADPDVLILDEPTRGIDVGAKYEIYTIINEMAAQGKAIIVISSELPELLGICDRIYALSAGRVTGEVDDQRGASREAHAVHDQREGVAACLRRLSQRRPIPNRSSRRPSGNRGGSVLQFLSGRLRQIGIFIALIAIVILFQVLTGGTLLTPRNVTVDHQPERVRAGPGHRHGDDHHRRPHRPVGRLGGGLRRRDERHLHRQLGLAVVGRRAARQSSSAP